MRTRSMTLAMLALALTACVTESVSTAPQEMAYDTGLPTSGPLALQAAVEWPPKAVANQAMGEVPDFGKKNGRCLECHDEILIKQTPRGKETPNLHVLHLQSKKTAYKGSNRDCLTCHEMISPQDKKASKKEGWFFKGDVYHPNVLLAPEAYWKKLIVKPKVDASYASIDALRPLEPYPYKPTLKRLVCVECHGPDSRIKTLYGAPGATAAK